MTSFESLKFTDFTTQFTLFLIVVDTNLVDFNGGVKWKNQVKRGD